MHSLTDSGTVAYSRLYGICITKAIKQTRIISRFHLIAFSQFFNCLFSVGNRKKLKSGRLDLLFLQRGTLQYTMLTFSVWTNLATVGHVTFVPYDAEAHADCCDQSRVISHMVARMMNIHNPVSVGSCLPVRRFLPKQKHRIWIAA